MRALRIMAFVAVAMGLPSLASAQATGYICTPDAQVLRVTITANGSFGGITVLYTGNKNETFDDCEVGPDGWLYVLSGASVIRLDPSSPPSTGAAQLVALLGSAGRGAAFNVTTLYVNTATSGIQMLKGVAGPVDPLSFPDPATQLFSVSPSGGHGIVFDILGNLVLGSGNNLLRAPVNLTTPFYTTAPTTLEARSDTVFGTTVTACGDILYADKATRTIRKRAKNGASTTTFASFANSADYPVALEVDSRNDTYALTVQSDTGTAAKFWRIPGSLTNGCAPAAPSLLVDLSTLLSGQTKLKGLLSARGLGIAIGPTDASLTHTYNAAPCGQVFDFGFHSVKLTFDNCSTPFTVTIDALESRLTEVNFSTALGSGVEGLRYSPMRGNIVQYVLTKNGGPPAPFKFNAEYAFYAQETIATPGIAKTAVNNRTAPFTDNVIGDFLDVGAFDAYTRDRGPDFSKRVVFNKPLATTSTDCTVALSDWEEPFNTQNPLFKLKQNVKLAFTGKTATGANCGGGGTMRVSIVRIQPLPLVTQLVQSVGAVQVDNIMTNEGDRYWFNLDTRGFGIGTFLVTIWGDQFPPFSRTFIIGQ